MTPSRHQRMSELLDTVLDLDPAQQRMVLDRECADDPSLRTEIESLLDEDAALDDGFLEMPAALQIADLMRDSERGSILPTESQSPSYPETLGAYRILHEIDRGGMGTVFLAEQQEPIVRRVALKVLHGLKGEATQERLAMECRALAKLKHPNIAIVHDAGVSEEGLAYVAMEWVEGTHMTRWCDAHQASMEQRLELFLQVCAGVAHAHQKGIIHQDLKPSNVLVGEVDGRAVAKIIDFGIARAVDDPGPTSSGRQEFIGSPVYMSPEAARIGEVSDVDTRTDIFSLGILLFQLLVGVPPIEASGQPLSAILRRLQTTVPPPPSRRWTELDPQKQHAIAAARRRSVGAVGRRLRGDLDAIVGQATARDREARYASVTELASDLKRHLSGRTVSAREPSMAYSFTRFVRRNLGSVIAALIIFGVLIVGLAARTQEARRANQEAIRANAEADRARQAREEATQISEFLIGLFEIANPDRRIDDPQSVEELLAEAEARMDQELADQPLARARFLQTLGRIAMTRGDLDRARTLYEQTLSMRETHQPSGHSDIVTTLGSLGVIHRRQGQLDRAEDVIARAIELLDNTADPDPAQFATILTWQGNLFFRQLRHEEAAAIHRRALGIRRGEEPQNFGAIGESLNNLSLAVRESGHYAEARPLILEAETYFAKALGPEHPLTVGSWLNLAGIEERLGNWEAAERLLRRAARTWNGIYGPTHSRTLLASRALGALWHRWHRVEESTEHLQALLAIQLAESGEGDRREVARTQYELGQALQLQGEFTQAKTMLQDALETYTDLFGEDSHTSQNCRARLAILARKEGHLEAAARVFEQQAADIRQRHGDTHPRLALRLHELGVTRVDLGRSDEARAALEEALAIHQAGEGRLSSNVARGFYQLGRLQDLIGRHGEAVDYYRRAVEIFDQVMPDGHPEREAARSRADRADAVHRG